MAPEVLMNQPYNEKCDIWGIGHIFYILLAYSIPFETNEQRFQAKYKQVDRLKQRSPLAIDLLNKMFTVDPDMRISAKQALDHGWFQDNLCLVHETQIDESQKKRMLDDLKLMRDKNKLRRIVLSYLSSQQPILTKEEQQEANIIFKQFDKDKDGRLGKADVAMAFKEIYAEDSKLIDDEEMQMIIDKADTNGDGFIDIAEWHTIALSHRAIISD